MPAQAPADQFVKFPCTGVLNEWMTPATVGGSGLTDCMNLIYHRMGSWGKRPGALRNELPPRSPVTPVSGFRWYRAFPTPKTKLVFYAQGHLFIGDGIDSLVDIGAHSLSNPGIAPSFCSARDPQANQGNGADILIIAGLQLSSGSFGTGDVMITQTNPIPTTLGSNPTIQLTVQNGSATPIATAQYSILPTDNPSSILQQIADLINDTAAYLNISGNPAPFLGESYMTAGMPLQPSPTSPSHPNATLYMGALMGGSGGNSINYQITLGADWPSELTVALANGTTVSPGGSANENFTGGGNQWEGPVRYDFTQQTLSGLSYMAPNAFTGCTSWHNHVFFWGDPNNADTVFACDINQPEAFTFMIQNGGMTGSDNGGYTVGAGDGDSPVYDCVPLGNALYIFKTSHIYMMEGYDFQTGEYEFNITPQVYGYGVPSNHCVAVLENQLVFWSGRKFLRLAVGAYEPEHIGLPIPLSEGRTAAGLQSVVRAVAGDFQIQTLLANQYVAGFNSGATSMMRSVAMFAVDYNGTGVADTILIYDDETTDIVSQYAWSKWSGWKVGYWIPFGGGPNPAGTDADKPLLLFLNPEGSYSHQVGGHAADDWGNPIPWMAQTGWVDFGTPEIVKNVNRVYINSEALPGAAFTATIIPGRIIPPQPNQLQTYSTTPQTLTMNPTTAPDKHSEAYNDSWQYVFNQQMAGSLPIQAKVVLMQFNETGGSALTAFSAFELLSWGANAEPKEALT